jgi:competence protein ComEC
VIYIRVYAYCIFIQTPSGRQVLIDGGISPQRLTVELGAVVPFWDRTLDMVVLTHPDSDHMAAQIEMPRRYRVTYALDTAASQANPNGELWRAAIDAGQVEVALQHTGAWIDLGDGAALWVLWPPEGGYIGPDGSNENSLVLKLVYGHFSALLTGDAGLPSEMDLIHGGAPLQSTVLKVGHHGSRHSTGPDFVRTVQPWLAVIQVGENRYGHPHPEVLTNLADHGVLRNDLHGRVHVWTDGAQMWVETER